MLKTLNYKRQATIVFSIITFPMFHLHAAEIEVNSKITAVTIYPGSAKVTRESNVSLVPGNNEILIKNLPINLNESSFRVTGEGSGSVNLGSVELSRDIQQDVVQEQEKRILEQIDEINEKRNILEDAITRNNAQLEYIKKMVLGNNASSKRKDEGQNGSYTNLPLEQWQNAWKTLDEATKSVQEEIRSSKKALKDNKKVLNKLKRNIVLQNYQSMQIQHQKYN